ncbi:hypothetical protein AGDE_17008 [Angomonas deanei]|uniref:Uncharacterized protein n=1 Tax=Angomonas deanei TaxID=59799 RepID=A0A7G2CNU9_9TRYP|nr:hypothetical protein AGDE_17008 [Angomonas deanei]CAD2220223.1 hypothetical protein, conserved [Angomonas deanei]|eukprot:EPY15699.1 hypothetical protein AGDE_17008 [Angomonas deanei]
MNNEKKLLLCINKLEKLALPSCVSAAEEITYLACKEKILEEMKSTLNVSEGVAGSTSDHGFLTSDPHELAKDLIARTFDQHRDVVRNKLKEAEEEAEKWKNIALQADPDAEKKFGGKMFISSDKKLETLPETNKIAVVENSTQTECESTSKTENSGTQTQPHLEMSEEKLSCLLQINEIFLDTVDKKNMEYFTVFDKSAEEKSTLGDSINTKKTKKRTKLSDSLPVTPPRNRLHKIPDISPVSPLYRTIDDETRNGDDVLYSVQHVNLQQRSARNISGPKNKDERSPLPKII